MRSYKPVEGGTAEKIPQAFVAVAAKPPVILNTAVCVGWEPSVELVKLVDLLVPVLRTRLRGLGAIAEAIRSS